jgi:hypothetical protein
VLAVETWRGGETALTELDNGELRALVSLGQGAGGAA